MLNLAHFIFSRCQSNGTARDRKERKERARKVVRSTHIGL
jgi:hypothetical protein